MKTGHRPGHDGEGHRPPPGLPPALCLAAAALGCIVAGCGSSGQPARAGEAGAAVKGCGGNVSGGITTSTAGHLLTLAVGPEETMYSPEEAAASHPASGEVMISGTMATAMGGMGRMPGTGQASGQVSHLEVHICDRSGRVVTDAHPTISITDTTAGGPPVSVPVAVMEGVDAGPADLHYGNNVEVVAGHAYTVEVAVAGEVATFHLPRS